MFVYRFAHRKTAQENIYFFDKEEENRQIYERSSRVNPSDLKKLFYLKVIQYRNGTVLIPKMNHLAGDGYSYFFFLSALAKLSKAIQDPK